MEDKGQKKPLTLKKPDNYILLLFTLSTICIIYVFFAGGYKFFIGDTGDKAAIISLGMLTFISIFFSFIIKDVSKFLAAFKVVIDSYEKAFHNELKEATKDKINLDYISDFRGRYSQLKEYKTFVNPTLWFYLSIIMFLLSLVFNLTSVVWKGYVISVMIHLGLLTTLFLISSILSVQISYILVNRTKYIKNSSS